MRLNKILIPFLVVLLTLGLVACQSEKTEIISDGKKIENAKTSLDISFTVPTDTIEGVTETLVLKGFEGDVSITWKSSHEDIISNTGVVVRPETDTEVILTATLTLNGLTDSKIFSLTVLAEPEVIDYGLVTIPDLVVYINSNRVSTYAEIKPVFTKEEMKEELTYSILSGDSRMLAISEDDSIIARKPESSRIVVKAESAHFSTQFNVDVIYHNYNDPDFEMFNFYNTTRFDVNGKRLKLKDLEISKYTIILGDSFTDERFIGNFLKTWGAGKYVIDAGIGLTTSFHWEAAFSHIIGSVSPKNIVINIGTNNFYDANASIEQTVSSIQRLFMYMHTKYPESKIYYFGISQRTQTTFSRHVTEANMKLEKYCSEHDYLTFVDAGLTNSDLYDGIHPNTTGYTKMFNALLASGIEILKKD